MTIGGSTILVREIFGNAFGLSSRDRRHAPPGLGLAGGDRRATSCCSRSSFGIAFGNPQVHDLSARPPGRCSSWSVSVYGWWRWWHNQRPPAVGAPDGGTTWASRTERAVGVADPLPARRGCFVFFRAIGRAPGSLVVLPGRRLDPRRVRSSRRTRMARGLVDFWLCWIARRHRRRTRLLYFGVLPQAVLYVVYGAVLIWGFFAWRRLTAAAGSSPDATDPRIEAVDEQ